MRGRTARRLFCRAKSVAELVLTNGSPPMVGERSPKPLMWGRFLPSVLRSVNSTDCYKIASIDFVCFSADKDNKQRQCWRECLTIKSTIMKIVDSIKASYTELVYKVTWPTRKELTNSAVLVLIASLILALVVWLMDLCFEKLMSFIYGLF